jgi:uncharacterized protein YndB with AHSA1/START domain
MNAGSSDSIVKEITIQAPAERVFAAIADPLQRVAWWGVAGKFQTTHMESDLRPGGEWQMRGTGLGGKPFTICGEYRAVERPRLLEFTWLNDQDEGAPMSLVRFDLLEQAGQTTVRLTHSGLTTDRLREGYQGWPWLLALLKSHAEGNSQS